MYLHKRIIFYLFSLFIFCLNTTPLLYGQDYFRFNGPLNLQEFHGSADYHYTIRQGDTILNGPFSLRSNNLDALVTSGQLYYSIDGTFSSGLPDSTWTFRFGDFRATSGTELIDFHFKVKVNGVQHIAITNFQAGNPEGNWNHTVKKVDSSEVEKRIFESHARFENGLPQGSIRLETDSLTMLGRFLRSGLAHDIWELNFNLDPQKIEKWYFLDGWLQKIAIQNDQDLETIPIYIDQVESVKKVNLDHRYFKILSLQNLHDSTGYKAMGGRMASLINDNAKYYQRLERFFNEMSKLDTRTSEPQFLVKVAYYPVSDNELQQLQLIRINLQKIDTASNALLGNTRLNMLKHSDQEVLFLLATVEEINDNLIRTARNVVEYQDKDLLNYFPRKFIQPLAGSNESPVTEIMVRYQDSTGIKTGTFIGPEDDIIDTNNKGFAYLADLTTYALITIDSIESNLSKKLTYQRIRKELEGLEKKLLAEEDQLIHLVDSLRERLPGRFDSPLKSLKSTVIAEVAKFSAREETMAKPAERVQELIQCIQEMQELAMALAKLPSHRQEIQNLYTEEVWNPFTATVMNDQLKERITSAYENILIPYMLGQIESELSCDNVQQFPDLLSAIHLKMQQLRKKDTSKLERKLKKEDDPQVVLQLLEITS